jgi:hypothetical protein
VTRAVRAATAVIALIAGATSASLLAGATTDPAAADPIGDCSTTVGVIVVVDFSHWGHAAQRGCAAHPTTGFDALVAAGFTPVGDAHDGPAFVCRIDDEPSPSEDPCIDTPPATAYWSYWRAVQGQSTWSYSEQGAMSYEPPAGSVEAWTFGPGQPPAFSPGAVIATNVSPPPTTTTTAPTAPPTTIPGAPPSGVGSGSGAGNGSAGGSSVPAADATSRGTAATAPGTSSTRSNPGSAQAAASGGTATGHPAPGSATTGTSPVTAGGGTGAAGAGGSQRGTGARASPRIVDASPAAARASPAGSPVAFLAGALVVLLLAVGGGVVVWRRRRADHVGDE